MNIYTVSFFGHRYIERGTEISDRFDKLLHDLITQKEYVDFLIGRTEILICLPPKQSSELSINMLTVIPILRSSCRR